MDNRFVTVLTFCVVLIVCGFHALGAMSAETLVSASADYDATVNVRGATRMPE